MLQKTISDLNRIYSDADRCDAELFSEQRSNVRLVNGEHFQKRNKHYWQRIKDSAQFPQDQKIRITQNHIHNISKTYVDGILSLAQDAVCTPKNESELQDQKSAELNNAVWADIKQSNNWDSKRPQFCSDFYDLGEVAVKVFFDKDAGEIIGYEPELGQDGRPLTDEMGQPVMSQTPRRRGQIKHERIFAFNLLRDPNAKSKEDCKYLIHRYMIDVKDAKAWVGEDTEKLSFIRQSADETYKVFNGTTGDYEESKDQVMIRELFYKPCAEYPNGYYFISTPYGKLFEGELPDGKFPIIWTGFDDIQTSCRSRSAIKQQRPYQAEINRAVSTMVEIQLSNGFDKVFIQSGAKIAPAQYLPGVRAFSVSGLAPTIVEGRTGDQYLGYINMQIDQMYKIARIEEIPIDKVAGLDPYAMLFLNARQKKVFSMYATKFGKFLCDIAELSLQLAKFYYTPEMFITAAGRREAMNIPEFLNTDPLSFRITVKEGSEDSDSAIGKQLSIGQLLQYAGGSLSKEQIGKLARNMPYLNKEEILDDLTIDYDSAKNVILALDRGERPKPSKYDDHKYMIKKLTLRMRQADYQYLDQQIQFNYEETKKVHEEYEVLIQKDIQAAQAGFIPAGGILVTVDFYVEKEGKQQRVRLPQDSIDWLIEKLNQQGAYYEQVSGINDGDKSDMSQMFNSQPDQGSVGQQAGMPQGMGQQLAGLGV